MQFLFNIQYGLNNYARYVHNYAKIKMSLIKENSYSVNTVFVIKFKN